MLLILINQPKKHSIKENSKRFAYAERAFSFAAAHTDESIVCISTMYAAMDVEDSDKLEMAAERQIALRMKSGDRVFIFDDYGEIGEHIEAVASLVVCDVYKVYIETVDDAPIFKKYTSLTGSRSLIGNGSST